MELDRLKDIKLHGAGKVFHMLVMIITYPLRHFFKFLAFLIVFVVILAAIPMMKGVRYTDIPDWYMLRYDEIEKNTVENVIKPAKVPPQHPAEEELKEVSAPKIIKQEPSPAAEPGPGRRQAFKRAGGQKPQTDNDIKAPRQYPVMKIKPAENAIRPQQPSPFPSSAKNNAGALVSSEIRKDASVLHPEDNLHYRKDENLPLVYEEEPAKVSGQAFVFSANELSVGNTYIILYGIFTDPRKYDQEKAHQYMKELADGKMLVCRIVAYTYQNIATGICFLDGQNINQNLVDAGFADNVAL